MTDGLPPDAEQLTWRVNGLTLAGMAWGKPGGSPVMALHGWLDNAASFALVAPLLDHCRVVALDLTGHGKSDWRSADASYQIWDDLPEIAGVADCLGWEQFSLLGHSRGAIISTLLASAMPERISKLVLLDALVPQPLPEEQFSQQLRAFLLDKPRLSQTRHRVYASADEALSSRQRGAGSLPQEGARRLVERNLTPCEGGYRWSTDPRLRGASAVKLSEGHVQCVLQALCMPSMLLLAEQGHGGDPGFVQRVSRYASAMTLETVAGGHHFHMEAKVRDVASRIAGFIHQ